MVPAAGVRSHLRVSAWWLAKLLVIGLLSASANCQQSSLLPVGSACTASSDCAQLCGTSGLCTYGNIGDACQFDSECNNDLCTEGVCDAKPCTDDADCSNYCEPYLMACTSLLPIGDTCTRTSQCQNGCVDGVCAYLAGGEACSVDQECQSTDCTGDVCSGSSQPTADAPTADAPTADAPTTDAPTATTTVLDCLGSSFLTACSEELQDDSTRSTCDASCMAYFAEAVQDTDAVACFNQVIADPEVGDGFVALATLCGITITSSPTPPSSGSTPEPPPEPTSDPTSAPSADPPTNAPTFAPTRVTSRPTSSNINGDSPPSPTEAPAPVPDLPGCLTTAEQSQFFEDCGDLIEEAANGNTSFECRTSKCANALKAIDQSCIDQLDEGYYGPVFTSILRSCGIPFDVPPSSAPEGEPNPSVSGVPSAPPPPPNSAATSTAPWQYLSVILAAAACWCYTAEF